jgi:LysR family pca operon transcriptional activator
MGAMDWEDRIGRRIKFRDLHIVLAVAQSGSMLRAAEALAISQPVVSKVIADLEHVLGARLFDRSRKGVEPTPSGRALLNRARGAFDELKQGVKEIEFLNDPSAGDLQIGASQPLSEGLVLAVIDRLSRQFPRVGFQVLTGDTLAVYELLRERRVELGVARVSGLLHENDHLEQEALFEEPLVVVASIENRWVRRRKIELAELLNEPWTWPLPGSLIDRMVVEAFRARGLEAPRATVHAESFNMRVKLAATGRFLAVVHASMLRFPAKDPSIKLLPVEFSTASYGQIGLITLKNRTLSPLAQLFIRSARDLAKPLARRGS